MKERHNTNAQFGKTDFFFTHQGEAQLLTEIIFFHMPLDKCLQCLILKHMMFLMVPHCAIKLRKIALMSGVFLLCLGMLTSQTLASVLSEGPCECGVPHVQSPHADVRLPPCCSVVFEHSCCRLSKSRALDVQDTISLLGSSHERQTSFGLVQNEHETSFTGFLPQDGRISFITPDTRSAPIYLQHRTLLC